MHYGIVSFYCCSMCELKRCSGHVQVMTVQKYFRRMLAKCLADQLRLRARCQHEKDQLQLVMKVVESESRLQRDFQRRLNPRTKDDFELLYNAMEGQVLRILGHYF